MTRLYLATGNAVGVVSRRNGRWAGELALPDKPTQCLAVDPRQTERLYCGTFGDGLWISHDAGATWHPAGDGIAHREVMALAVGPLDGVLWAGTEPSALFRSEDGGRSWVERTGLQELPSKPTWSFPPRPWTHHVRWIAPDRLDPLRLFVGIELGGVMRSLDGGLTWEDRKPNSQWDAHTLATHPMAPGRVYEAAGGGYAESRDGGATWRRDDAGLRWRYLWGLAVDPADPDAVVVSASPGPMEAHSSRAATAALHRRGNGSGWQEVTDGLPPARGTQAYVLATNPAEPGVFYAAPHDGDLYRSADQGRTWEKLDVAWPDGYRPPDAHALVAVGE
ncbi:MAG TPA: hypothetical protein VG370_22005 [Chloroflexota bacterium]|jgi:photosystem II stability/assembly factor-like uncharacterized protein|nr:hypothetical protein [Chloroflexota bacterium]